MSPAVVFALICAGFLGSYVALAVTKRLGDEIATWVLANDESDEGPSHEFGLELEERRTTPRLASRSYLPYVHRYRKLRRARGQRAELATKFTLARATPAILLVIIGAILLVTQLLE